MILVTGALSLTPLPASRPPAVYNNVGIAVQLQSERVYNNRRNMHTTKSDLTARSATPRLTRSTMNHASTSESPEPAAHHLLTS